MSILRRIDLFEPYHPSLCVRETSIFAPKTFGFHSFVEDDLTDLGDFSFALDLLNPRPISSLEVFDAVTDLVQIEKTPSLCSYKRVHRRIGADLTLQSLCDRVAALESSFDLLVNPRRDNAVRGEQKYTWTAEIKGPVERKYKWTAEIKGGEKKKEVEKKKVAVPKKKYKWMADIKDERGIERSYKFEASTGDADEGRESTGDADADERS